MVIDLDRIRGWTPEPEQWTSWFRHVAFDNCWYQYPELPPEECTISCYYVILSYIIYVILFTIGLGSSSFCSIGDISLFIR